MIYKFIIDYEYKDIDKAELIKGIVFADSYAEAARKITEDYGEDEINRFVLLEFVTEEENGVLELNENWGLLEEYL